MLARFPTTPGYIQTLQAPCDDHRTEPYNIALVDNTVDPGPAFVPLQAVRIDSLEHNDWSADVASFGYVDPATGRFVRSRQRVVGRSYCRQGSVTYGKFTNPLGTATNQCTLYLGDVRIAGSNRTAGAQLPASLRIDIRLASPPAVEVLARVDFDLANAAACPSGMVANVAGPLGVQWEFWAQFEGAVDVPTGPIEIDLYAHFSHLGGGRYSVDPGELASLVNKPWL